MKPFSNLLAKARYDFGCTETLLRFGIVQAAIRTLYMAGFGFSLGNKRLAAIRMQRLAAIAFVRCWLQWCRSRSL